ncbi:Mu transposase C-terminal domain-containing protein [Ferruginivarius sediminum]|uniref:Integrase catalytic domain-containing protein n=1 Tax=Ferruginivarius sediminum TaxID=2661937 RepID=A0A369T5L4_9PROT|nr:Mu transposase C-terminal domain-containing protein [Ferruginivarius sediminum]RDD60611.1 hypothetical protein DRB17_17210 [Ferruginivarius sediminum]
MSRIKFEPGEQILLHGQLLRFVRRTKTQEIVFTCVETGVSAVLSDKELAEHFRSGDLKFRVEDAYGDVPHSDVPDIPFSQLSHDQQEFAITRRVYIEAALKLPSHRNEDLLRSSIARVAREIGDQRPPSARTLRRAIARYKKQGRKLKAVAPHHYRKGNRNCRFAGQVVKAIEAVLDEEYQVAACPTLSQAYGHLPKRIERLNRGLPTELQHAIPSYQAFCKIAEKLDMYEVEKSRHGKRAAKQKYAQVGEGLSITRPLERVEMDHKVLDNWVLDDETLEPLRRPILTAAIDYYSRMLLGYHLSFSTGLASVMASLRHAMMPKAALVDADGVILTQETWDCFGVPETVFVDNGAEFHASALAHALYQVGSGLEYAAAYTPEHKGIVERFFGTVRTSFCAGLDGFTFSNPQEKGDYDPQASAGLTFSEYREKFERWLIDVYGVRPHSVTGEPPLQRWREGTRHSPVRMLDDPAQLTPFSGRTEQRKLQRQGISLDKRRYQSPELADLLTWPEFDGSVDVYVNPASAESIWVYHPRRKRYVEVPAASEAPRKRDAASREAAKIAMDMSRRANADIRAAGREASAATKKARKRKASRDSAARSPQPLVARAERDFQPGCVAPDDGDPSNAEPLRLRRMSRK